MMNSRIKDNPFRYLARVTWEADTPVVIGSGERGGLTDSLVQKDVNGLPYVPASSIAGCLRHALAPSMNDDLEQRFFGFQDGNQGQGSRVIFTDARLVGPQGVVDGLHNINFDGDDFFRHFSRLPVRDHVRLSHQGTTETGGKFDEEIVYKGARFCFEIELVGRPGTDAEHFAQLLQQMSYAHFRIGAGSRSGFGKVKVIALQTATLDLTKKEDLQLYLDKSSALSDPARFWQGANKAPSSVKHDWDVYKLELSPRDFFLFGAGSGDDDADMRPVVETRIKWNGDSPRFDTAMVLVPGSSVKGALAHRVAYHYNRRQGVTLEKLAQKAKADGKPVQDLLAKHTGCHNQAVQELFGAHQGGASTRGNVLISDVIQEKSHTKLLNHVSVDRFTGGAVDGVLFTEKTWAKDDGEKYFLELLVAPESFGPGVIESFEDALKDLARGLLPLGGGVNRGHGVFVGKVEKNSKELQ